MLADPVASSEGTQQLAVETSGMLVIDILDHAAFFQVGASQTPRQRAVLLPKPLLVDQQCEALFEGELAGFGGFQLSAERIGDSVQFHGMKFVDSLLVQHVGSFLCRRYCTSLVGES